MKNGQHRGFPWITAKTSNTPFAVIEFSKNYPRKKWMPLDYWQKTGNFPETRRNNRSRKNISKKNTDATIFPFEESLSLTLISEILVTRAWVQMVLERNRWLTESLALKFFGEISRFYSLLWKRILAGGHNYTFKNKTKTIDFNCAQSPEIKFSFQTAISKPLPLSPL